MKEYVKELINLSEDIEKRTNEAIKKISPTKFELLDKAIEKIHSHYDELLDSIEGKYYSIDLKLDLDDDYRYSIELYSLKIERYAYLIKHCYSFERIIINAKDYVRDGYGHNQYSNRLKNNKGNYYVEAIELLTKHHKDIQEQIKKHIEEKVIEENLRNSKRISNEVELIDTLESFITN